MTTYRPYYLDPKSDNVVHESLPIKLAPIGITHDLAMPSELFRAIVSQFGTVVCLIKFTFLLFILMEFT